MNPDLIDYRVAELMASRLCHDLISPIGAVGNGLELLEDELDREMAPDALRLAGNSARQASIIVQFYRLAFGRAGGALPDGEIRRIAEDYLQQRKCRLAWPQEALPRRGDLQSEDPQREEQETGKLILNLLALASESLPRGGEVRLEVSGSAEKPEIAIAASGRGAGLRPEVSAALTPERPVEELTPRSVQAFVCAILAQRMGAGITVEPVGEGALMIRCGWP